MFTKSQFLFLSTLLGTIFFSANVQCQDYESVIGFDSIQWNVVEIVPDAEYNTVCKLFGDTIIEGKAYKKGYDEYNWQYTFLREDSSHTRLWIRLHDPWSDNFENEVLIFDLNLELGDTFHYIDILGEVDFSMVVTDVIDSSNLKIIEFNELGFIGVKSGMDKIRFIEGIGPTNLGWSRYKFFKNRVQDFGVICKWENGNKVYGLLENDSCSVKFLSSPSYEGLIDRIEVYPNPASQKLIVQGRGVDENHNIILQNSSGQIVKSLKFESQRIELDVESLEQGVYLLTVFSSKRVIVKKVILK